ncbi:unnamed protein product [Arctogadus glacialis]
MPAAPLVEEEEVEVEEEEVVVVVVEETTHLDSRAMDQPCDGTLPKALGRGPLSGKRYKVSTGLLCFYYK